MTEALYLFARGLAVHQGRDGTAVYRIVDRRPGTTVDGFGSLAEYLLADAAGTHVWVDETQVWPVDAADA